MNIPRGNHENSLQILLLSPKWSLYKVSLSQSTVWIFYNVKRLSFDNKRNSLNFLQFSLRLLCLIIANSHCYYHIFYALYIVTLYAFIAKIYLDWTIFWKMIQQTVLHWNKQLKRQRMMQHSKRWNVWAIRAMLLAKWVFIIVNEMKLQAYSLILI